MSQNKDVYILNWKKSLCISKTFIKNTYFCHLYFPSRLYQAIIILFILRASLICVRNLTEVLDLIIPFFKRDKRFNYGENYHYALILKQNFKKLNFQIHSQFSVQSNEFWLLGRKKF